MLKKHSKLVVLFVMVTFLFTMVGSAGAAAFSDVSGNNAEAAAVYKLNSLGIINGYTDGTFQPENTITRAEFAKIAGYLAGLGSVAEGMQSAPSTFKDVKTSDWFNGSVNLAYSQGFVKGYPDGTFKPNAVVTQAEVVTVFMRILGYNDNLAGNWPADYVSKAATLGVLDDVSFASNSPATRGITATVGAAVLDENVVVYKASDNVFEEALKDDEPYTLLSDKFDDAVSTDEVLVTKVRSGSDGYVLDIWDFEAAEEAVEDDDPDTDYDGETGIVINKDVVVSGAQTVFALEGCMVDLVQDDDEEVTYIQVLEVKAPVFGAIDSVSSTTAKNAKIEIDDVKYELNDNFFVSMSRVFETEEPVDTLNDSFDVVEGMAAGIEDQVTTKIEDALDANQLVALASVLGANTTDAQNLQNAYNGGLMTADQVVTAILALDEYDDYVADQSKLKTYIKDDAKIKLFFDEDDKIIFISIIPPDKSIVVESVDVEDGKIKTEKAGTLDGMDEDDDFVILKNGVAEASLSDIKAGDLIYNVANPFTEDAVRGFDRYVILIDASLGTGKLEKYYKNDEEVVIAGKTFDLAANSAGDKTGLYLVDSSGDDIDNLADLVGSEVVAKLDGNMEVAYLSGETSDSGALYGVIIAAGQSDPGDRDDTAWIKLCNKEGKQLDLDIEEDYWDDDQAVIEALISNSSDIDDPCIGKLVKYELNSAGEVDELKPAVTATSDLKSSYEYDDDYDIPTVGIRVDDAEEDHDRLYVDGAWRYVEKSTIIWDADYDLDNGDVDPELATWADIEDAGTPVLMDVYYDGTDIDYIVVFEDGGISDSGNDGVFVEYYEDGEDEWLTFAFEGAMKEFKGSNGDDYTPGYIYTFEINDDEVDSISGARNTTGDTTISANIAYEVTDIDDNTFELENGISYSVNDDTMVVIMDGDDVDEIGEFGDLDEGDSVYVLEDTDENEGYATIIVILDE